MQKDPLKIQESDILLGRSVDGCRVVPLRESDRVSLLLVVGEDVRSDVYRLWT